MYYIQNIPNPFNPTTKIKYQIPAVGLVTLKVYNIFGAEVATLVNETIIPGSYEVGWNAADFPSGVYFCKLTAGNWSEVKKMVMVR